MAQKLATTLTLLLFLLVVILVISMSESSQIRADDLIYLPALSHS